jgi:hypothetical protein
MLQNKYGMHEKKRVYWIQVCFSRGGKWLSPSVLLHWRGNSYSSQLIYNKLDSYRIYIMTICHPKVLEFRILHVELFLTQFTDGTNSLKISSNL